MIEKGERIVFFLGIIQSFILKRGWRLKLAKTYPVEQSLFVHSINELGAVRTYLESYSHPFTESEVVKLYIASITHDCEKETDKWQEKVRLGETPPHHTNPEYAKKFVSELLEFLNRNNVKIDLDQEDINDIISSQPLHMKAAAKSPRIVFDEMTRKHKSERWSEIAHLIDLFDDIVSLESVESSIELLNRDEYSMVNERLEFEYHKIGNVRGVLTSLLHKACEKAYERHGFTPFIYYVDGSLYFRIRRNTQNTKITVDDIKASLENVINDFIHSIEEDSKVVIENPQTKLFRGREFFDKQLIEKYFFTVQRKYRPKVDRSKLKTLVIRNFDSLEIAKENLDLQEIKDSEVVDSIMQNIDSYSDKFPEFVNEFQEIYNISVSKSQQYFFQLFKEIIEEVNIDESVMADIEKEYNAFFGNGAYKLLKSLTNDPNKNFNRFIKPYWEKEIPISGNTIKVKHIDVKKQSAILLEVLANILKKNIDKCSRLPKNDFVNEIVELLTSDLIYPYAIDVKTIANYAEEQLAATGESKMKLFNKSEGERLCPVCYKLMPNANPITAAFLSHEKGVAKVFNNQSVGASGFGGSVNICRLCYAELLLRRVILGRVPSDLVILFPSLNFAKVQGSDILVMMKEIQNKLGQFFSFNNPDLNVRPQLNNIREITTSILEKSVEEISAELNPDKFIESFKIEISDETRKNDLNKLKDKIKDFWDSVEDFNKEFGTTYTTFKEIGNDIFENKCMIPETERNQIIEEAGVNPIRYSLVCETPNFIMISLPLTFKYNEDEAEINILLKRILFACYMYLLSDCAVMVISGKEIIHIPQTRKMVYIQPSATLKQVIKEDWISLFDLEKWMNAISAAVKLAYEGGYSSRSGIFEVLIQPTAGHILSRITSQKTRSGAPRRADVRLISILDKLQDTGVLKNEAIVDTKI
ncbi:MAG: hypothetical protein SVO01_00900 [Thermotogota bacterium]|nr:hypothetical protein [Thermotogota bacterium]